MISSQTTNVKGSYRRASSHQRRSTVTSIKNMRLNSLNSSRPSMSGNSDCTVDAATGSNAVPGGLPNDAEVNKGFFKLINAKNVKDAFMSAIKNFKTSEEGQWAIYVSVYKRAFRFALNISFGVFSFVYAVIPCL